MKERMPGVFERLRRRSRTIAAVLLIACLPLINGCFGSFPLTKAVYRFNGDVSESKWWRELVFLAFVILPVYGIATLGDAVIFNLVEFWTGETLNVSQTTMEDGTKVRLEPGTSSREAVLTVTRPDGTTQVMRFVRSIDGKRTTVYENGTEPIGYVVPRPDGSFDLQDARGESREVFTPNLVSALRLNSSGSPLTN